jgi:hypothetical protein
MVELLNLITIFITDYCEFGNSAKIIKNNNVCL